LIVFPAKVVKKGKKEGQATYIAPLQPSALATFLSWWIRRELVVQDLPRRKSSDFFLFEKRFLKFFWDIFKLFF